MDIQRIKKELDNSEITRTAMVKKATAKEKECSLPIKGIYDWCRTTTELCEFLLLILPECFGTYDDKQRVCFICSLREVCGNNTKIV